MPINYKLYDKNNNLHILYEGENYEVLSELEDNYNSMIQCIYIDPLYNAKNKSFKNYNDNIKNWTQFMKKRLLIAKKLLSDNGIISISIGEEVCSLKLLCDEIFGTKNKLAMISIKTPNQTEGKNIINNTDYLLIYKKSDKANLNLPIKKQEARCTTSKYSQAIHTITIPAGICVKKVPDGIYENPRQVGGNEDLELVSDEPIVVKNGKLLKSIKLRGRWSCPNDVKNYLRKIETQSPYPVFNKYGKKLLDFYLYDTKFQPRLVKSGFDKPSTFWDDFLSKGKNELKEIIGDNNFTYPKHSSLIKYILSITISSPDSIVLDFFAGSGTTMQAVAELNEEHDTNIKSILVTNNENNIIHDITLKRLKKSGLLTLIKSTNPHQKYTEDF